MRSLPSVRCWLFALVVSVMSAASFAQVSIAIRIGPPALPVYEQPLCPAEGYIWTPGYWAYDYDYGDYYWVPGTWVLAPEPGFLWTPGYWGWGDDRFIFHEGYWGPRVGFYGGINYGFGYFGNGYEGGRWDHDRFFYNRSVNNVNVTNIHNVYNTTVRQSRELQRRQRRNRCAPDAGRRSCGTRETRPPRSGSNATCASGANQPGTTGLVKPRKATGRSDSPAGRIQRARSRTGQRSRSAVSPGSKSCCRTAAWQCISSAAREQRSPSAYCVSRQGSHTPSTPCCSEHGKRETRPEVPTTAGKAVCEAATGPPETPAETGAGPPADGTTASQ